jgi:hypothetical protein
VVAIILNPKINKWASGLACISNIIAIFVYELNQEQLLYPWVLECDPRMQNKTLKTLSIMRQLKNCKKGHFVKYNGVLYQINCFFTGFRDKRATLVEVKAGSEGTIIFPSATEKVEYLGDHAKDENGNIWTIKHKQND